MLGSSSFEPASNASSAEIDALAADAPPPATSRERDYRTLNRLAWEHWAPAYVQPGRAAWQSDRLEWGIWGLPESELRLLDTVRERGDVIELGCGTGAVLAWLARRGFRPVGVDFSRRQVETAKLLQSEFGVSFPLLCANAEEPFFDYDSFDCVISEYGVSLWGDPARWLPEAARVLRPGGLLVFVTTSAFLIACTPHDGGRPEDRLVRDYFDESPLEFPGEEGAVEFHLTHGEWIQALGKHGLSVERLVETRPPSRDANPRVALASVEWATRWPTEEIWLARKTG